MTLRIAVWAVGTHARRNLLPALRASSTVRIGGLLSRDRAVARATAVEYGVRAFDTSEQLLADPDIDAIVLAGPNALHYEQAMACIAAGKHVFVEKTLAAQEHEVIELAAASEHRGVVLAECFMFVHHPQFAVLRELLHSKRLGPMRSVTARFGFPHLDPNDIRYSQELAGGALNDVGAYCLAAFLHLFDSFPLRVDGLLGMQEGWRVDTDGSAIVTFGNGVSAFADWGFGRAYMSRIEAWCRDGLVTIDRAFAKPPLLETTVNIVHQRDNRSEVLRSGSHNHFVSMFDALAMATRDGVLARKWRDEALRQARFMEMVRSLPRVSIGAAESRSPTVMST